MSLPASRIFASRIFASRESLEQRRARLSPAMLAVRQREAGFNPLTAHASDARVAASPGPVAIPFARQMLGLVEQAGTEQAVHNVGIIGDQLPVLADRVRRCLADDTAAA